METQRHDADTTKCSGGTSQMASHMQEDARGCSRLTVYKRAAHFYPDALTCPLVLSAAGVCYTCSSLVNRQPATEEDFFLRPGALNVQPRALSSHSSTHERPFRPRNMPLHAVDAAAHMDWPCCVAVLCSAMMALLHGLTVVVLHGLTMVLHGLTVVLHGLTMSLHGLTVVLHELTVVVLRDAARWLQLSPAAASQRARHRGRGGCGVGSRGADGKLRSGLEAEERIGATNAAARVWDGKLGVEWEAEEQVGAIDAAAQVWEYGAEERIGASNAAAEVATPRLRDMRRGGRHWRRYSGGCP
eukprot:365527-Chlamydomonas_euryale.AAC.6